MTLILTFIIALLIFTILDIGYQAIIEKKLTKELVIRVFKEKALRNSVFIIVLMLCGVISIF